MAHTIVQINFGFDGPLEQLREAAKSSAAPIAEVDGLLWKIYILNEEGHESGGIYLFRDAESAQAYIDSDIIAGVRQHFSNVSIKSFAVMAESSVITRAPSGIGGPAR